MKSATATGLEIGDELFRSSGSSSEGALPDPREPPTAILRSGHRCFKPVAMQSSLDRITYRRHIIETGSTRYDSVGALEMRNPEGTRGGDAVVTASAT